MADIGLAARCYAAQDYQATEAACQAIILRDPADFDALHLLGVVLSRQDRHTQALAFLNRAASVRADNAQLQTNRCNAFLALGYHDQAMAACQQALRLAPDDPGALNNLGLIHKAMGDNDLAIAAFRQAASVRWDHAGAWFNLGTVLGKASRPAEALQALATAARVAPLDTPPHRLADIANETGRVLLDLGRPDQALAVCRRFLRRHPDMASVRWNLSLALLLTGQYEEGWREYERRFDVAGHDARPAHAPVLDPNGVAGKRVLILQEQGRGDMLQFVRYAESLAKRGARVSVQAYPDLVELLSAMPAIDHVVGTDAEAPDADLRTPVMSLPLAFGTTLQTVPAAVPYLRVPPNRLARWRDRLGPGSLPRIGLTWAGSSQSYDRSAVPLAALAPLIDLPGFAFHAVQKDIRDADRTWLQAAKPPLTLHDSALQDFADTAGLLAQMDAVVTIDTAVAHLAGALALPVRLMLPFNPDFRWLLGRSDSPWYPTMRLFRQESPGDWSGVVAAVAESLRTSF